MSKALGSREPARFTPAYYEGKAASPFYDGQDVAPVFLVRAATMRQRARWNARLSREGLVTGGHALLAAAFRNAVRAHVHEDDQEVILEIIGKWSKNPFDVKLNDEIATLEARFLPISEEVRNASAIYEEWTILAPLITASMFLEGWENVGVPFARGPDGVDEALLEELSDVDVRSIGYHAMILMSLTRAQVKNLKSPPLSEEPQVPSTRKKRSAVNPGKSSAKSTKKTRATSSRRKAAKS